jgi:tRNA uridine 5-carboxymethylaminomethyl modification enzyme
MPEDVQIKMLHSVIGLEHAEMTRCAYAIEYDCVDPLELHPTLETKKIAGLYGAGQFNGSSGYEEAAVQGFVAGVNAALKILGRPPMILDRSTSYIGTLIDDLVTKGTNEPYRMMTSRSEYRLILRQDNADERLTPIGYGLGLISEERYQRFLHKQDLIKEEKKRVQATVISPSPKLTQILVSRETSDVKTGIRLIELLKRPELNYEVLTPIDKDRPDLDPAIFEQVEIAIKYEGYIKKQIAAVENMRKLENKLLPENIDYRSITGLRLEAQEKLSAIRPLNIGQASRISCVSPADVNVLMIYLVKQKGGNQHE